MAAATTNSPFDLPEIDARKVLDALRDAAYVTVGFGVLAVQKTQEIRNDLSGRITERMGDNGKQVEELISSLETRLVRFDDAVQARVDDALGKLGERLPDQAGAFLAQANSVAKTARTQVRSLVLRNAA